MTIEFLKLTMEVFNMYEIYEGKTEQHRKKTYLVFKYKAGYPSYVDTQNIAKRFFRVTADHIKLVIGYTHKGDLYLDNPKNMPKGAKSVRVAYWVA